MSNADERGAGATRADQPNPRPRAPHGRVVAVTVAAASVVALAPAVHTATRAGDARAPRPTVPAACAASAPRSAPEAADTFGGARFRAALAPCAGAMHADMHAALATPNASADALFAAAMIPHHQGAVDMARQLLVHGRDPELRAFALGVVAEQQAEIQMLRAWVARHAPPPPARVVRRVQSTTQAPLERSVR